jgi:hypothetical protein
MSRHCHFFLLHQYGHPFSPPREVNTPLLLAS